MPDHIAILEKIFAERFKTQPEHIVRAPGRVNLIGEHTDYNDGFVLPVAIDRAVWIALRTRDDNQVRAYTADMDETAGFPLKELTRGDDEWIEYLKGTAWALHEAGFPLHGWDGVIASWVPVGAGLSSSAALEMATARAFSVTDGFEWDPATMARVGQRAENDWVGVKSGIMDQMASAAGQAGHALLIDCRSLEYEPVPLPAGTAIVILDTSTRRGLVDSAYNERQQQCAEAAALFEVPALRDVPLALIDTAVGRLDEITYRRARHVVTENARVIEAVDALRAGDAEHMGRLMASSHISLRDDFEVSTDALDAMAELAQQHPACYGARMTGAGFGGCAVALVDAAHAEDFAATTAERYQAAIGVEPSIYVCTASDGASHVK